jgi:hypothetical protein
METLCPQVSICGYPKRRHVYRWVHVYLSPSIHPNIYVYGHPSIFRYMHFGAASRHACGRAVAGAGVATWVASALGYNHCFECVGVSISVPNACMRVCVCVCACVVTFCGFGPFEPMSVRVARRARPHARAVHCRWIFSTKVKALPEWLGQCKLLETLCVPPQPRRLARSRRRRRCAAARAVPRRALGRTTRR